MLRARIGFLVLSFSLCTYTLGARAAEVISGVVTNESTTAPIAGIDIDVFDSTGSSVPGVTDFTNASGQYSVTLPGPGTYFVRADAKITDGVGDEYYNNALLKSAATPIVVGVGQTVNNINFTLPPGVAISGTITSLGAPLVDIDIDVYHSSGEFMGSYNATSLTGGAYSIGSFPPGQYIVRANPSSALGQFYVTTYYGGVTDRALATLVNVGASNVTGIDIDVAPGGTIGGFVRDASTMAPLGGIDLDLFDILGNRMDVNASTNGFGQYEIGVVPAGDYILRVDPTVLQGYARTYYANASLPADATPIAVTNGQRHGFINFNLGAGGFITGSITVQGSGTPIANIDLDVYDSAGRRTDFNAASDAGGLYLIGPMPPGQYIVRANPTIAQGYADEVFNNQIDVNLGDLVTVTAGANTPNVNFTLVLAATIGGTIANTLAQPLSGIDLDLFDFTTGVRLRQSAITGVGGTYQFDRLNPGTYIVRADPTALQGFAMQYYSGRILKSLADSVATTAGVATTGIDFTLVAGGSIAGNVSNSTYGVPVNRMDIDVYDVNTSLKMDQTALTNSAGNYVVSGLPAGQYIVAVDPLAGQPYFIQYFDGASSSAGATIINVSGGSVQAGVDFPLVVDASLLPVGGVWAVSLIAVALVLMTAWILWRWRRMAR